MLRARVPIYTLRYLPQVPIIREHGRRAESTALNGAAFPEHASGRSKG